MISWLHDSGISGWWKCSAYLSAFLPGEHTPRCALARSNLIYICTSYTCLHTGDFTTPLLSAQRVSPLRFVGINKQNCFSKNARLPKKQYQNSTVERGIVFHTDFLFWKWAIDNELQLKGEGLSAPCCTVGSFSVLRGRYL